MKKLLYIITILVFKLTTIAQTNDYRTAEDGINKLLSNPQFVEDAINISTSEFSGEKLNEYFTKYVPEYTNFKIGNKTVDFSKIYYANVEGASTDNLADLFGSALKLNPAQTQNLKNTFSGNLSYSPTSSHSTGLANQLYDRGKNAKVDYAVDYAVDFFQNELGDGGLGSALIDIGGGILGNLALAANKREQERIKEAIRLNRLSTDNEVFLMGYDMQGSGNIFKGVKLEDKTSPERMDLQTHFKARKNMPSNTGVMVENVDYKKAIQLLDETIGKYKQNPERAYYLYHAYIDRAICKMQLGAHRGAIIDYYFGQKILENILSGKLPDNSIYVVTPSGYYDSGNKKTYLKGKIELKTGSLNTKDLANIILNRAFAKYRAQDYKGAISDSRLAIQTLVNNNITSTGIPNDYKDISRAIEAMSEFGLNHYKESYDLFTSVNLNDEIINDSDKDGVTDFSDSFDMNNMQNPQAKKESGVTIYYGFPTYFPFDIVQVRGLSFYKSNKINEAIGIYENIVSSENSSYQKTFTKVGGDISAVLASLGSFYYKNGNYKKSISLLDQAISLSPEQLEYYYKRGSYKKANNQLKEAEADFKIVKNPALLKKNVSKKQNEEYYLTKYEKAVAANDKEAEYKAVKEGILAYPNNNSFYRYALKYLNTTKNYTHANEFAQLYQSTPERYHILKYLSYEFSADTQNEKEQLIKAFENGSSFYNMSLVLHPDQRMLLQKKTYYCELMTKFTSRTNNSFIPINFDKEKTEKTLDSTYTALGKQYSGNKMMDDILEKQKKEQKAKFLGNYEEYLKILDSQKMLLEMSPIHAFDKIEILFILGKRKEAIEFAKKVYKKGKLMKGSEVDPNSKYGNAYYYGIENIANGSCGG